MGKFFKQAPELIVSAQASSALVAQHFLTTVKNPQDVGGAVEVKNFEPLGFLSRDVNINQL